MFLLAAVAAASPDPGTWYTTDGLEDGPTRSTPVVGGVDTDAARWPGISAVFIDGFVECTGTLVAPRVVLTAGHCAEGIHGVSFDASDVGGLRAEYAVERVIAHPRWARTYDVALVILREDAPVAPAVIAQGCALDALVPGAPVNVVGYGAVDARGNRYVDELQAGTTAIIDPDCTSEEKGCNPEVSPGGELAAGGNGVDACFGDSGGPIYVQTEDGMLLAGVTSRAFDDADLPCSEGGIYVRADAVIDWIEAETGLELEAPACGEPGPIDEVATITSMSYEVGVCGVPGSSATVSVLLALAAAAAVRRTRS